MGRIELHKDSRRLLVDGEPAAVGARAFDLLLALVERQGQVVTKDELLDSVWSGLVVEENNLTVQVSALRRLLGKQCVVTVPGRGYQLGVPAEPVAPAAPAPALQPGAADVYPALPNKPSISVVPFANLSGPGEEYFCDGVTEDVITELARFRSLFVISRNSSFSYKGRAISAQTVGEELGVRYVLEGSIRRAARQVRVTAQLVEAATGTQVWAEKYDRVVEDIFAVQEELTRSIVSAIAPQIELTERSRRPRPGNLSAYELALRAWSTLRGVGTGDHAQRRQLARQLARQALAVDPHSALAIRTIAWAQFSELWLSASAENVRAAEEAVGLTERVTAADNSNHDAYYCRGLLQFMLGRPETGLQDLRRAHELNPNDASTMNYLGYFEALCGHPREGSALAIAALRLSPRDPQRYLLLTQVSWCHFIAGEYDEAVRIGLQAVSDAPWFAGAWLSLAVSRAALGDVAGARSAADMVRQLAPDLLQKRVDGQWLGTDAAIHRRATALLREAAGATQ